tara:strand:- start:298 stop:534 length:237 start_codon:yes stop_codon:yes gene_type:complete
MDNQTLLKKIILSETNCIQIILQEYKGSKYGDVREFHDTEDGKRVPTKNGITFSPEVIDEIIDGLTILKDQTKDQIDE